MPLHFCQVSLLNQIQSNQILMLKKLKDFQTNAEIEQGPELASAANTASTSVMADDGLLTSKNDTQSSLVLPVVSEAARIKKMLLAYRQEIDYIRSTVVSLGISQDELPAAPLSNIYTDGQPNDKDFRSLMIKLAEHRAALRKIPFKPPMLYFYVSSGYGMRKHPKTGKKAFHHGIDLAGTWQENVRTSAPGKSYMRVLKGRLVRLCGCNMNLVWLQLMLIWRVSQ